MKFRPGMRGCGDSFYVTAGGVAFGLNVCNAKRKSNVLVLPLSAKFYRGKYFLESLNFW